LEAPEPDGFSLRSEPTPTGLQNGDRDQVDQDGERERGVVLEEEADGHRVDQQGLKDRMKEQGIEGVLGPVLPEEVLTGDPGKKNA
jgi:hypothetical protein